MKSLFDFIGTSEATSSSYRLELDIKEKRKRLFIDGQTGSTKKWPLM